MLHHVGVWWCGLWIMEITSSPTPTLINLWPPANKNRLHGIWCWQWRGAFHRLLFPGRIFSWGGSRQVLLSHLSLASSEGGLLDAVLWQPLLSGVHQENGGNWKALSHVQVISSCCLSQQGETERCELTSCTLSCSTERRYGILLLSLHRLLNV